MIGKSNVTVYVHGTPQKHNITCTPQMHNMFYKINLNSSVNMF